MQKSAQPSESNQNNPPLAMQKAIADDRNWFNQHPKAIVRFRPAQNQEFEYFERLEEQPPTFIPCGYSETAPRNWVAVVEIMRMTAAADDPLEGNLRLRICTVPIRSKANQANAAKELIERVSSELLDLAGKGFHDQQMPDEAA